ncbi:MAG: NPCBM/NEW2 domain-containing protein [Clostridia bacterium]|nr:NPCBM/NEW2 domain-containing protein [Clostridia bacterium]
MENGVCSICNDIDEDEDVFSTKHYHCIRIEKNFTSADGTYDLSAKFNTFSATIYGLGDGESGSLKIYADGVCVFSDTSIDPNTRPFQITLDVTGVMDLKFEMIQYYNSYIGECFGLSDVYIQKTVK